MADALATLAIKPRVLEALATIFDPEIPVNIQELGLIYGVEVASGGRVRVEMTLTAPGCPSAQQLPLEVEDAVRAVSGVTSVSVEVVWEPPWTPDRMSEAAKLQLGFL